MEQDFLAKQYIGSYQIIILYDFRFCQTALTTEMQNEL